MQQENKAVIFASLSVLAILAGVFFLGRWSKGDKVIYREIGLQNEINFTNPAVSTHVCDFVATSTDTTVAVCEPYHFIRESKSIDQDCHPSVKISYMVFCAPTYKYKEIK